MKRLSGRISELSAPLLGSAFAILLVSRNRRRGEGGKDKMLDDMAEDTHSHIRVRTLTARGALFRSLFVLLNLSSYFASSADSAIIFEVEVGSNNKKNVNILATMTGRRSSSALFPLLPKPSLL